MTILKYIKSVVSSVNNSDVKELMEQSVSNLRELSSVCSESSDRRNAANLLQLKEKDSTAASKVYYRSLIKKDNNVLIIDIAEKVKRLVDNGDDLLGQIVKDFPMITFSRSLSTKQAILLRAVDHYVFLSTFTGNFLLYLTALESGKSNELTPAHLQQTKELLSTYSQLMSAYSDRDVVSKVNDMVDVIVTDENIGSVQSLYSANKLDPLNISLMSGFTNPIRAMRMAWTEYQVAKFHENKELVKSIRLRLQYLEKRRAGEENAVLEKEILYSQEELERLQYDIEQMERV